MNEIAPGVLNGLADVPGLSVGHAEASFGATGATVLRCAALTPASVDVRGGGPAGRETDLLKPGASVGAAHAIVLSGGSVFGLAAAEGVVEALSRAGVGLAVSPGAPPVPIVPAACLYDLPLAAPSGWGDGGPPYRRLGAAALADAEGSATGSETGSATAEPRLGPVGAGRGARAGAWPGGWGEASLDLGDGLIVAAGAAANPVGSPYMGDGASFWAWPLERRWRGAPEFGGARPNANAIEPEPPVPPDAKFAMDPRIAANAPSLNTIVAAVATSADLSCAELNRVAIMAQDGLARAVRPAHTGFDGDTIFALGLGGRPLRGAERQPLVSLIGAAAADCLARAVARGVHAARLAETPAPPPA